MPDTGPGTLAEAIMMALEHPDRAVRSAAIAEAAKIADPDALVRALGDQEDSVRRNAAIQALTIGGGTGDVQRNIIAERVLDLPHDVDIEAGRTWAETRRAG